MFLTFLDFRKIANKMLIILIILYYDITKCLPNKTTEIKVLVPWFFLVLLLHNLKTIAILTTLEHAAAKKKRKEIERQKNTIQNK